MSENWPFLSSDLLLQFDEKRLESPIECAMFRCMHYLLLGFEESRRVGIDCQVEVGSYRVDFLLTGKGGRQLLIVECDGHDFHDRTKEQAARDKGRDRDLMLNHGLPVMRFTGSEIHAKPFLCACEAVSYAMQRDAEAVQG